MKRLRFSLWAIGMCIVFTISGCTENEGQSTDTSGVESSSITNSVASMKNKDLPDLEQLMTNENILHRIRIPLSWDFYVDMLGFGIDCKNENILMQTVSFDYLYDYGWIDSSNEMTDFTFADGVIGYYTADDSSIMFVYPDTSYMHIYSVHYTGDPEWYHENEEIIFAVAKTLSPDVLGNAQTSGSDSEGIYIGDGYSIPFQYDGASLFSEGFAAVNLGGEWGYIDKAGNEIVPFQYDSASAFSGGLALVKLYGKYGFIDKTGNVVVPCIYDDASGFSGDLIPVKLNGKWGFIDKTGNEQIPFLYDDASNFNEGLAAVNLGGQYGYIDNTGKTVVQFKYDSAYDFTEGLAPVELNGKNGFIDRTGNEVIPFRYDNTRYFSDGLAAVCIGEYPNEKWGFIDNTGHEVISLDYDDVNGFREKMAVVVIDKKYGYIDETGKVVIPLKYDNANSFSEGLAVVTLSEQSIVIDKSGKEILTLKYPIVDSFSPEGLASVEFGGKWGMIDRSGNEIIPLKYDVLWSFTENMAHAKINGRYGFLGLEYDGQTYRIHMPEDPEQGSSIPFEIMVHIRDGDKLYNDAQNSNAAMRNVYYDQAAQAYNHAMTRLSLVGMTDTPEYQHCVDILKKMGK